MGSFSKNNNYWALEGTPVYHKISNDTLNPQDTCFIEFFHVIPKDFKSNVDVTFNSNNNESKFQANRGGVIEGAYHDTLINKIFHETFISSEHDTLFQRFYGSYHDTLINKTHRTTFKLYGFNRIRRGNDNSVYLKYRMYNNLDSLIYFESHSINIDIK